MAYVLLKIRSLDDLTVDQLKYVTKPILLEYYSFQIRNIWGKLPEHIKADPEIQSARSSFGLGSAAVALTESTPLLVKVSNIKDLPCEHLKYISKTTLLEHFEEEIDLLWGNLPTHIRIDPQIRECRKCDIHHRSPQIFGIPMKKHCRLCNATR